MVKNIFHITISILIILIIICNYKSIAQSNDGIVVDSFIKKGNDVVSYEEKSWKYLSKFERLTFLKEVIDTSSIFTNKWSSNIFPYRENSPPDSVYITYLNSNDSFIMPIVDRLNSGFGYRKGGFHKGLDIHLRKGAEVKVAFNGKVRYARYNSGGYGNLVIIRHFNGLETYYAHLSQINVSENQIVESGEILGLGGNSGAEWVGPHLHFEIRYHDFAFDPQKMISLTDTALIGEGIMLKRSDFNPYTQVLRKYHKIKSGDTLSHLAVKYNTTVSAILKLNSGLSKSSTLNINQKIRVR